MSRLSWLTPDTSLLSAPVDCRTIQLNPELWQYITGALLLLTYPTSWEAYGSATPEESAAFFTQALDNHLMSLCAYVGELRAFAVDPLPDGWILLDGSILDADDYPALADVVPSSWLSGGNINLPDMTGKTLVGSGTSYTIGDEGGEETHTLTVQEMPAHDHSYDVGVITIDIAGELPNPAVDALAPSITGSTGGGGAHNNMPPYVVINWGIYSGALP